MDRLWAAWMSDEGGWPTCVVCSLFVVLAALILLA